MDYLFFCLIAVPVLFMLTFLGCIFREIFREQPDPWATDEAKAARESFNDFDHPPN